MKTGYLLIADILGFGNIIKNVSDDELSERISEWTTLVKELGAKHGLMNFQLLSDTLFLFVEGDNEELFETLVLYCQDLLQEGIKKSLPIKGAITFGKIDWGDFIYGKAVIEAHNLEIKQNWIGITLNGNVPHIEKNYGVNKIVCYTPPMKSSDIKIYPVITWDIPDFSTLASLTTMKGLTKKGEVLGWSWGEKIRNTIEFRVYLKMLKTSNFSGETFKGGFLPIEIIDMNIK